MRWLWFFFGFVGIPYSLTASKCANEPSVYMGASLKTRPRSRITVKSDVKTAHFLYGYISGRVGMVSEYKINFHTECDPGTMGGKIVLRVDAVMPL